MESIKEKFEEQNSDRAWFKVEGRVDCDTPEGYVYDDFTTDMCWTCFFTIYQEQDTTINFLKGLLKEAHDWVDHNNFGGYDAYDLRDKIANVLKQNSSK